MNAVIMVLAVVQTTNPTSKPIGDFDPLPRIVIPSSTTLGWRICCNAAVPNPDQISKLQEAARPIQGR
jgi:hypothetical protein